MSRNRSRDPLGLPPHWHVDCRLEAELPEDNIVGTRFLTNVLFSALALGALLFAGWLGYLDLNLHHQIGDWEQRIRDNRAEVMDIKRMQTEYAVEAAKVDQAYQLVRPQFYVTGLVSDIGRTRPDAVVIDIIEWNDAGVIVRGTMKANSRQATETLDQYVRALAADEKIGPLFDSVKLTDFDRGVAGDTTKFEIVLKPKAPKT
jgi:hypothetical protein